MINIKKKGFTLIELLVSLSIVTLLMSVVFFGYRIFSNRLAISAATQQIALSVRQAQVYGLSAKQTGQNSGDFNTGYGISFDSTDPGVYYMFIDKNHNGIFDIGTGCGTATTECVEKNTIPNSVSMSSFCGITTGNVQSCPPTNSKTLNIVFKRPNPDAKIAFGDSNGHPLPGTYTSVITNVAAQGGGGTGGSVQVYDNGLVYLPPVGVNLNAPKINNFSPQSGPVGTLITLFGTGFVYGNGNTISINGYPVASNFNNSVAEEGQDSQISFTMPTTLTDDTRQSLPGKYTLRVINQYGTSNSVDFFILPPCEGQGCGGSDPFGNGGSEE